MKSILILIAGFVVAAGLARLGGKVSGFLATLVIVLAAVPFLLSGQRRGWWSVAICGVGVWLIWPIADLWLITLAVAVTVANLWSYGIMHNFIDEPEAAPDSWALVNMISSFAGLALLAYGIYCSIQVSSPSP